MSNQRRIQGRGTIQRLTDNQLLNTIDLPPQRTIQAVGYYKQKKEQLKRNPSKDNKSNAHNKDKSKMQIQNELKNIMNNKSYDPNLSRRIKQVHVQPVIKEIKESQLNQAQYPLDEDQIVQVVQQRYFPKQNYYHYIYESQLKKEVYKFANQTQANFMQVVNDHHRDQPFSEESAIFDKSHHQIGDEPKPKPRGEISFQFSKVSSKQSNTIPVGQLVPVHIDYTSRANRPNLLFTVNQNQRLQISRRR